MNSRKFPSRNLVRCVLGSGSAAAVAVSLSFYAAGAADLPPAPRPVPIPATPPAYLPTTYNWSGFYIGGHLGGGFSNSAWSDPFTGANNTFNSMGFLGGGQLGFNTQFNMLVLGLEGDFTWTGVGLKSHGTDSIGDSLNTTTNWTSTVTGRIGAAFDSLLIYGKGGLALAQDQSSLTDLGGNTSSTTLLRTGWTVGGGLEYALSSHWSAKVEYDYLGFGSQNLNFATPLLGSVSPSATLNVQEIKAGLNFHF
jgi:outer membrane immunogenic protein